MKRNEKLGFTLIEMLVVVAIAAMILSFVLVSVRDVKMKSRDSRREEDIKQLQNALALYANNNGLYPVCSNTVVIAGTGDSCLNPLLVTAGVLQGGRAPVDPLGGISGTCGAVNNYVYCYQSVNGAAYTIRYALEGDSILGKGSGWQSVKP